MLKTIEARGAVRPDDADLYVQARILEQLGLMGDATALYRQVKPSSSKRRFIPGSFELAQRRLKALGVKK